MERPQGRVRRIVAGAAATLLVAVGLVAGSAVPAAAVDPLPNPEIPAQCGLGVTLVLDASGSVQQSNAVGAVRTAAEAFLEAFQDTGSTARVTQFASLAEELAPRRIIDAASMASGGVFRDAINGYYNPIPPRPSDVEIKRFNSGSPSSAGSWQSSNSSNQYTNWDQSLLDAADVAGTGPGDLVVFITDGDPTAYDFNRTGDPFSAGPPPDVGVGTDRSSTAAALTLDRAVERANAVKLAGGRVLALGVGTALQNSSSVDRLVQISGPDVADSIEEFDVETTDVALIADFDDLAEAVRALVLDLCSPSLTIRKFAQSATDASYQPAGGWDITVTPTVTGGYDWILPIGATPPSATVTTSDQGFAQFQWEPSVPDATSSALVTEDLADHQDFTPGRPGEDDDYRCEFKNAAGDVRVITGEWTESGGVAAFELTGIGNEIGTCSVFNSFDYEPEIALTKVNSPTSARGDLTPPAVVRSSYEVTNPGNTPLSNVTGRDDKCAPVVRVSAPPPNLEFNIGDTNLDNLLDTTETWLFSCDREARVSAEQVDPVNVVNTATVQGTDPAGTVVDAVSTDDVDVFVPRIGLTKLVDGQEEVAIAAGTTVTYTYAVENRGNAPLAAVSLVDDTPPCESPARGADAVGNGDGVLDVGEVWTYSCVAGPTASVLNTARVLGTPIDPHTGVEFSPLNPQVTATDTARVQVSDPGLELTKAADQTLVFPGTQVIYTYEATNTGTSDLRNDTGGAGWVVDDNCEPVGQVLTGDINVGDANQDGLLNPGETWQFSCARSISLTTVNTATIVAQPVIDGIPVGGSLTREAVAIVDVVRPAIGLTKTSLVAVVLDPSALAVSGPDVPERRPAEYLYEVSNLGSVPLRTILLTDDLCDDPAFVEGDSNDDGILDVDEVWLYGCVAVLSRSQATPPPTGAQSAVVTNTATVTGTPFLPDDPEVTGPAQTAVDMAQVVVIQPGIAITKTATPDVVRTGQSVTYTFEVTNTGGVGLEVIDPTDDKCAPLIYVSGDDNGDGLLDGANSAGPEGLGVETWTYVCSRTLGLPPEGETADVNTVAVQGIDPLGNLYESVATAEVVVLDPDIDLVKSASDNLVLAGSEVTYGFDVTNVGNSPVAADDILAEVTLKDVAVPDLPDCRDPALISRTGGDDDDLLSRVPAETWHYECTGTVSAPTTNLAAVTGIGGTSYGLRLPVVAFDAEFVQTFAPAIQVDKTATPLQTVPGGEVTYTYEVRNTGDVPLDDVVDRITDDTCSPASYVSGDEDADGLLDTARSIFEDSLDETWRFECRTAVAKTTTNTVVVAGTPTDPVGELLCEEAAEPGQGAVSTCDPTAQDAATVTVVPPLPPTGGQLMWPLMALGSVLIAVGALVLVVRRRTASLD